MRDGRTLLPLIVSAAEAAAQVIRGYESRRAELDWREKGASDFVTEVDLAAEAAAIDILRRAEPDAEFIAEESASVAVHAARSPVPVALRFIIDPLDGTTNFIHGVPDYAVSIGVEADGTLVAGVVLNVARKERFEGVRGGGATIGGTRLRVSTVDMPKRALIGTGFPFRDAAEIPVYLQQVARIMIGTSGVRRAGAASIDLAHVAAGRLDGFWENTLSPWDVAAGILLIREAGGVCTDFEGRDSASNFGPIVTGNPVVHKWLLEQIRPSRPAT
jgi:myo-inositol-1(or 4)-monophosphatase